MIKTRPKSSWELRAETAEAQRDELLAALKRAVDTIRAFHSIGLTYGSETGMWQLYQQSPEMQQINAAIAKAEQ